MDPSFHSYIAVLLEHDPYIQNPEDLRYRLVFKIHGPGDRYQGESCYSLSFFSFPFVEDRDGRALQGTFIEGDIVVRNQDLANPRSLNAHLANPDRLWPNGLVSSAWQKLCLFFFLPCFERPFGKSKSFLEELSPFSNCCDSLAKVSE